MLIEETPKNEEQKEETEAEAAKTGVYPTWLIFQSSEGCF